MPKLRLAFSLTAALLEAFLTIYLDLLHGLGFLTCCCCAGDRKTFDKPFYAAKILVAFDPLRDPP